MDYRKWLYAAVIRVLRTMAQAGIAALGTSAALADVNWSAVASTAVLAGFLSLLMSVAGLPEVDKTPAQSSPDRTDTWR